MDLLMSWQSGIKNAVATSGTALTAEHLKTIKRLADTLILSFDKDPAGLSALERSLEVILPYDFNIKAIDLGEFKDPADAAEKDSSFLPKAVLGSTPVLSYLLDIYLAPASDEITKKRNIRHLLEKIAKMSALDEDYWMKKLAEKSGVGEKTLYLEISKIRSRPSLYANHGAADSEISLPTGGRTRAEIISEKLLSLTLLQPELKDKLLEKKTLLAKSSAKILDDPESLSRLELRAVYEFSDWDAKKLKGGFEDLLKQLQIEYLRREADKLQLEIKKAESLKNEKVLKNSLNALQAISRELHHIE